MLWVGGVTMALVGLGALLTGATFYVLGVTWPKDVAVVAILLVFWGVLVALAGLVVDMVRNS